MLHSCGRMFNCNCAIREGVVMHASLECVYMATTTTECKSKPKKREREKGRGREGGSLLDYLYPSHEAHMTIT